MSKLQELLTEHDVLVACNSAEAHAFNRLMSILLPEVAAALGPYPVVETDTCIACGCGIVYDPLMRARIAAQYPNRKIISACMECAAPHMVGRTDEELNDMREMARPSAPDVVDKITNERIREEFEEYAKR